MSTARVNAHVIPRIRRAIGAFREEEKDTGCVESNARSRKRLKLLERYFGQLDSSFDYARFIIISILISTLEEAAPRAGMFLLDVH